MDLDLLLLSGFYGLVCFVGCGFFIALALATQEETGSDHSLGFYPVRSGAGQCSSSASGAG